MTRRSRYEMGFLALCALAACRPAEHDSREDLKLVLIRPRNPIGVYLNEPLLFDFSREVDPASVTRESLRIRTEDGEPAKGEFVIEGRRIRFEPDPVLEPDLKDGGYQPGTKYEVTLLGWPAPDGIRATTGEHLAQTIDHWSFTTVDVTEPRDSYVFVDDSPERCHPLHVLRDTLDPDEAILLGCEEPLDPSSLSADDFVFSQAHGKVAETITHEVIPVRPRMLRNGRTREESWPGMSAVIELWPQSQLTPGANYELRIVASGLMDLGGNRPFVSSSPFEVDIREKDTYRDNVIRESFLSAARRLPVPIKGTDGTALWSESGQVEVRYPRSAGFGHDGRVELGPDESRRDLHATRVTLVEGATSRLTGEPGLVVLRSQGRMEIAGDLRRTTGAEPTLMPWPFRPEPDLGVLEWLERAASSVESVEGDGTASSRLSTLWRQLADSLASRYAEPTWSDLAKWFQRGDDSAPTFKDLADLLARDRGDPTFAQVQRWADAVRADDGNPDRLSDWLATVSALDKNWTILIAGGDLVVSGSIVTDTPLMLVAGGMIRIYGDARAVRRDQIFLVGEGGSAQPLRGTAPRLIIDPPQQNWLVEPITFGVLSQKVPRNERPLRWISGEELGHHGFGEFRVDYVSEAPATGFDPDEHDLVSDPSLISDPGPVHFLIRLTLEPRIKDKRGAQPWNPPILDEIILTADSR